MPAGFGDDFPQTRYVVDDLRSGKPTRGSSSGFNSWEGQSRHRSRAPTPMTLRLGVSLWAVRMPNPPCRLGFGTGRPLESWKRSRAPGVFPPCHGAETPSSLHTSLACWSSHASVDYEPEIVNQLLHAQEGICPCLFFDTLNELQSYLGVAMLCFPSLLSSPSSNQMEVRSTGLSGTTFGATSTPQCPLLSGLCCHAWKMRWKTASTSSGFTAPWSDSWWTWPTHSATFRSVRPSDSSCAKRSVFGSLSSKSSAWGGESPHPKSGAGWHQPLVSWCRRSSAATSFVARSAWMSRSRQSEEAWMKYHALLLTRCWPSPPWDSPLLGTKAISVTMWYGSAPSSQLKTSASQWPFQRTKPDPLHSQMARFLSAAVAQKKDLRDKLSFFFAGMVPTPRVLGGAGFDLRVAVGAPPLSALLGGALVVPGSLLRDSGSAGQGLPRSQHRGTRGNNVATDRCPWGYAGVLFESFKPEAWCATPLTKHDLQAQHFLVSSRPPRGRAALVARYKGAGARRVWFNVVAQELALDAVLCFYTVGIATHIPGVSNKLPGDFATECGPLSRTFYHSPLSACHGSRLQIGIVGLLEDRRCEAQERNTGV